MWLQFKTNGSSLHQVSNCNHIMSAISLPRPLLVLLAVAAGASVANVYYAQPLLDQLARAFALDRAVAGAVLAATQAGSVLALLGLLPLADRGDRRRLLRLQLIALVLALLWLAASRTAGWLLSGMLLAGLLGTALTQGLIAYTAMLAPPEQRGRVVGVVQGGVFIGLLLARVVSGTVAAAFGWQMVYLLSAMVMAGLAALLWRRLPAVPVPSVPPRWR
jgi:predicted MFS family arabinose efflux permease